MVRIIVKNPYLPYNLPIYCIVQICTDDVSIWHQYSEFCKTRYRVIRHCLCIQSHKKVSDYCVPYSISTVPKQRTQRAAAQLFEILNCQNFWLELAKVCTVPYGMHTGNVSIVHQ